MKIRIQFTQLPALEIEGQPQDVAQMVCHLRDMLAADGGMNDILGEQQPDAASNKTTIVTEKVPTTAASKRKDAASVSGEDQAVQAETNAPNTGAALAGAALAGAASRQAPASSAEAVIQERARMYGGEPNRREKVLYCLEQLWRAGQTEPDLATIRGAFMRYFPNDSVTHLDQVIRDLANKTAYVHSPRRGRYVLREDYIKSNLND